MLLNTKLPRNRAIGAQDKFRVTIIIVYLYCYFILLNGILNYFSAAWEVTKIKWKVILWTRVEIGPGHFYWFHEPYLGSLGFGVSYTENHISPFLSKWLKGIKFDQEKTSVANFSTKKYTFSLQNEIWKSLAQELYYRKSQKYGELSSPHLASLVHQASFGPTLYPSSPRSPFFGFFLYFITDP